jgi:hypothetical protein
MVMVTVDRCDVGVSGFSSGGRQQATNKHAQGELLLSIRKRR